MKLILESGTEYQNPTADLIADVVAKLDMVDNTFAILEQSDTAFMQMALQERGLYALEYRDERGEQYQTHVLATQAQVTGAFQKYAQGDKSWLRDFHWEKMEV